MSKGKKQKPYGVGKSAGEIISGISRNIGRVTEKTLRQAVGRLASTMNKRIDRAAKKGESSPALDEVARSGGRFSTKGKTFEGLKSEFLRLKSFFKDPTSTREGWKKVQKQATEEAIGRGIIKPPTPPSPKGSGATPHLGTNPAPSDFKPSPKEEERNGWTPPPGWTWDEESRSWTHPGYGNGWIPYEEEGGGLLDPITGEIVGNTSRHYHDYDATADDRLFGEGTETGKLWQMVDSLTKLDPRFSKRSDSDPRTDPRMKLFAAIDDAWVENPGMSFEEARDLVAGRLDEIYEESQRFYEEARSHGSVTFERFDYDDDDWWD